MAREVISQGKAWPVLGSYSWSVSLLVVVILSKTRGVMKTCPIKWFAPYCRHNNNRHTTERRLAQAHEYIGEIRLFTALLWLTFTFDSPVQNLTCMLCKPFGFFNSAAGETVKRFRRTASAVYCCPNVRNRPLFPLGSWFCGWLFGENQKQVSNVQPGTRPVLTTSLAPGQYSAHCQIRTSLLICSSRFRPPLDPLWGWRPSTQRVSTLVR